MMMMIHTFLCCHKASEAVKYHAAEVATTFGLTDVAKLCGTGNTKPDVLKWIVTNIEQHCCGRYSCVFCRWCAAVHLAITYVTGVGHHWCRAQRPQHWTADRGVHSSRRSPRC